MNVNSIIDYIQQPQRLMLMALSSFCALILMLFCYSAYVWQGDWALAHEAMPKTPALGDEATLVAAIPSAHLFGQSTGGNMPISSLQLRVTGIVKMSGDQTDQPSKAYISISGQPSKIYEVGDDLPYGVKVYDITDNTVIVENDGHLEKLPLPREPLEFKAPPSNIEEN